jgi:hypothetical protein
MSSIFQTAGPVFGSDFWGRSDELRTLLAAVDALPKGVRRLYCVLGPRKIGKTSLLAELARQIASRSGMISCRIDLYDAATPARFFVRLVLALVDAVLLFRQAGSPLSGLADDETALTVAASRVHALGVRSMIEALEGALAILRGARGHGRFFSSLLDFPEALARETKLSPVVMLDEFQEVLRFDGFKEVKSSVGELTKTLRARWQTHSRVLYLVSGSEMSLLESMISSPAAPLFGHLAPLRIGPFPADRARAFLVQKFSESATKLAPEMIDRLVELTGGHPFYLQVLGEDLCLRADPHGEITEAIFKESVEECLLSQTGRLQLHFNGTLERAIGRSTTFERVLVSLASGRATVTEIAEDTHQRTGAVSTALKALAERDLVGKKESGGWALLDSTFGSWLAGTRSSIRALAGPWLLGDETERKVAELVAREGFRLVYRSMHSRGAFDLLALFDVRPIGLQVKRTLAMPYYLPSAERTRMRAWGKKLGWRPVLAVHDAEADRVYYFDVDAAARATKKGARFDAVRARATLIELI